MEAFLKAQTECCICFKIMVRPKSLKCLHTFCDVCVTSLMKYNTVVCPYCKQGCSTSDIKDDFKVQEMVEIRTQRERTSGSASTVAMGLTRSQQLQCSAAQLKLLRGQLCNQIGSLKQRNDIMKTQLLENVQACKRSWATAFNQQYDVISRDIKEKADDDQGTRRLIKARDMVMASENYLRTCQAGNWRCRKDVGMASAMAREVRDVMEGVKRSYTPPLALPSALTCCNQHDSNVHLDAVARLLISAGTRIEQTADDVFEIRGQATARPTLQRDRAQDPAP